MMEIKAKKFVIDKQKQGNATCIPWRECPINTNNVLFLFFMLI